MADRREKMADRRERAEERAEQKRERDRQFELSKQKTNAEVDLKKEQLNKVRTELNVIKEEIKITADARARIAPFLDETTKEYLYYTKSTKAWGAVGDTLAGLESGMTTEQEAIAALDRADVVEQEHPGMRAKLDGAIRDGQAHTGTKRHADILASKGRSKHVDAVDGLSPESRKQFVRTAALRNKDSEASWTLLAGADVGKKLAAGALGGKHAAQYRSVISKAAELRKQTPTLGEREARLLAIADLKKENTFADSGNDVGGSGASATANASYLEE
jgi:hypothetical protein